MDVDALLKALTTSSCLANHPNPVYMLAPEVL